MTMTLASYVPELVVSSNVLVNVFASGVDMCGEENTDGICYMEKSDINVVDFDDAAKRIVTVFHELGHRLHYDMFLDYNMDSEDPAYVGGVMAEMEAVADYVAACAMHACEDSDVDTCGGYIDIGWHAQFDDKFNSHVFEIGQKIVKLLGLPVLDEFETIMLLGLASEEEVEEVAAQMV